MRFLGKVLRLSALIGAGLLLAGCNPATKGWSSSKGESVSFGRLVAAKLDCGYSKARQRAINLLDASGNTQRNERRAAALMNKTESCMRKHGIKYRTRAYTIGSLRLK